MKAAIKIGDVVPVDNFDDVELAEELEERRRRGHVVDALLVDVGGDLLEVLVVRGSLVATVARAGRHVTIGVDHDEPLESIIRRAS